MSAQNGDQPCRTTCPASALDHLSGINDSTFVISMLSRAPIRHGPYSSSMPIRKPMPSTPDAIYRLAVDNDGDLENDIAFSYVFSTPKDGKQTVDVFMATGEKARSVVAVRKIFSDVEVSFGATPNIATSGDYKFFAGARSDAFFFDYDGIKALYDTRGGRNFTSLNRAGGPPWTGVDSNTEANVCSMVIELPTSELGANPDIRIWGRCSVGKVHGLLHVDRDWSPLGQQLLQHRRDQRAVQLERTTRRSRSLARSFRPPHGPHGELHRRRGHCGHR